MFLVLFLINIILGALITALISPPVVEMVRRSGFVRPNYRKDLIPLGVGFIFLLTALLAAVVDLLIAPALFGGKSILFLMGIAVITFLGLTDDALGSRDASGLKGHFKALIGGQLTTGGLKALGGGMLAFLIALSNSGLSDFSDLVGIIIDTLIITLSVNAINLLDLRPGRAAKGFIIAALIMTALCWGKTGILPLALILGSVTAYLPWDLKARAMMGDTGSNALGITVGMAAAWSLGDTAKLIYLAFLIVFHIFTEKYSLTKVIANNKVLDYLDKLGRD